MRWQGHVPVSDTYGDRYYADDGAAEAAHVFLGGCGLPDGFSPGFRIAELGFGTGLNLAVALRAWREAGMAGPLRFTSFEAHPLEAAEISRALSAFPGLAREARDIAGLRAGGAVRRLSLPDLEAEVRIGDARDRLPEWDGTADAWFLDGFAPAANPAMWEEALLSAVAARLAPGGRLATFTAAGRVRRALAAAGLQVERRPGFGRKRHMTVVWRPHDAG